MERPVRDNVATDIEAHINQLVLKNIPASPIYALVLCGVRLISASKGHVTFHLPITKAQLNSKGGIHGSVSATIVDWAGGMAITSWDLRHKTGASVDMHLSFLSSVGDGDEVEIEGTADRVGANLAFTNVSIYKVEQGQRGRLVATGSHTKFVRAP